MSKIEDGCLCELSEYLKPLIEQLSETLSAAQLTKLTQLVHKYLAFKELKDKLSHDKYQAIFKSPDGRLGQINLVKHRIDMK